MDCTGHAKVSVAGNTLTLDIWCTGTCDNGACKATWLTDGDIGDLHFTNGFASEDEPGVVHQKRQYQIRDTVENPKIQFSCDCGQDSRKFSILIERLEHETTVIDVVLKVLEVIITLGGSLIFRALFSKKTSAHAVDAALQGLKSELTKKE